MSIQNYKFKDTSTTKVIFATVNAISIGLNSSLCSTDVLIYKQDAIELAKHFKLTEEDLK